MQKTKCEYCSENKKPLVEDHDTYEDGYTGGYRESYMGIKIKGNELEAYCDFESGGDSVSKNINFCPMCGRKLINE